MNVIAGTDTVELDTLEIKQILGKHIEEQTGRKVDCISAVKSYDCTSVGCRTPSIAVGLTITLKPKEE
jgi:hypothetical protein